VVVGLLGCPAEPPAFPPPAAADGSGDDGDAGGGTGTTAMPPTDDGSTAAPAASDGTTGEPEATVLMLDVPGLDFGDVDTADAATDCVVVLNVGSVTATGLSGSVSGEGFAFAGGAYPGTAGTCGDSLDIADSCELDLAFTPGDLGPVGGMLEVAADNADPVVATLGGVGTGSTPNLLVNGDAEMLGTPPPGWVENAGAWSAAADLAVRPQGGTGVFVGESTGNELEIALRQSVDVSAYADLVDRDDLELDFLGWQRGNGPNSEPGQIVLAVLDARGDTLEAWNSGMDTPFAWTELSLLEPLPAGTRTVSVTLECQAFLGSVCDAYFDDLELYLVTP
jgi:hypothetical protein